MKGAVRKQWVKLTGDDLKMIAGEHNRLAGKFQECYGISKEEAERQVANWNRAIVGSTREYKRKAG